MRAAGGMDLSELPQGIFGIDLGTTYSVVGYIDDTGRTAVTRNSEGDDRTPSVVYFESADNVVVGKMAKESAGPHPDQVVSQIKRELGGQHYQLAFFGVEHTPVSISALILSALAKDAEAATYRRVSDVVIAVPAYFGLLEKDATQQAAETAGLNVIGMVPEPVAAALHYGVTGTADGTTFLVYDLGGGTFDITLIKMTDNSVEVLAVGGDHKLGGADWDKRLLDYIVEQTIAACGDDSVRDDEAMLRDLRALAEKTKKDLSAAEAKTLIVRYGATAAKFTVTRAQFEEMTADLLDETIRKTARTLDEADERLPGIRGRSASCCWSEDPAEIPAVSEQLSREFGWEPRLTDPDLAVAEGAALCAAGHAVRYVDTPIYSLTVFDEARYICDFIERHRDAGRPTDDLIARYQILLHAGDAHISCQVNAVRKYWEKTCKDQSAAAHLARMCLAEDERLRAEHGQAMLTRAWWSKQRYGRDSVVAASLSALADQLWQDYGQLGVVTSGILRQLVGRFDLDTLQAGQAAARAGLQMVRGIRLPDSDPIPDFAVLLEHMSDCGAASVPDLVHPDSGPFSLVGGYACLSDPQKKLDALAVDARIAEVIERGMSPTDEAWLGALKILRKALGDGADLKDVGLYHLVVAAREAVQVSPVLAVTELQLAGLTRADAAVIAILLVERSFVSSLPDADEPGRAVAWHSRTDFGRALSELMQRGRVTLRQVALSARISASSLGAYVSGRHLPPGPDVLLAILAACGVDKEREIDAWLSAFGALRAVLQERESAEAVSSEEDKPNLLFRIYIPSGRLYASEAEKMLSLFRDWLGTVRGHGVRQAGYQTRAGRVYEFFGDQGLTHLDMPHEFSEFSGFMTLCARDPSAAAARLTDAGLDSAAVSDLVARYGREARRLDVDLRHERERRILTIRHNLETELLDQVIDQSIPADQISSLIEALVPGPSAGAPLAILGQDHPAVPAPVTLIFNPQFISAVESTVTQNVQGIVELAPSAKDLLSLVRRFGEEQAGTLETAVYELEDPDARKSDRLKARDRLKEFLGRLGDSVQDIATGVLEKYLESKIGI